VRKYTVVILNQLNIKKIRSTKIILENITKKKQKEKKPCKKTL
jgi:heme exporter protein D